MSYGLALLTTLSGSDDEERYSLLMIVVYHVIVVLSQRRVDINAHICGTYAGTHTFGGNRCKQLTSLDYHIIMKNTEKGNLQRNLVLLMITM